LQISTDGFQPDKSAITPTPSSRCDYGMLIKSFVADMQADHKYSPPEVSCTEKVAIMVIPIPRLISTSRIERQNLTIRMQMRSLTRLTNRFSKKWENLWAAYCLNFACYNFCRIHKALRVTPAMESRITDRVWEIADLIA
jgi:hypothetical protein